MRKKLLIVIGIVAAVIALSVIAIVVVNRSPKLQNTVLKIANTNSATNVNAVPTNSALPNVNAAANADRNTIIYAARNFTELYGSGSTDAPGANIVRAKAFASKAYLPVLDQEIATSRAPAAGTFHSTLTKALVMNVVRQTKTNANVVVSSQRQETVNTKATNFNQDITLDFVKEGSDWKVNAAIWAAK